MKLINKLERCPHAYIDASTNHFSFTIRLSILLTLARACDKRFSADHDTMLSLLIKVFGPWAFSFYQTVFCRIFRREVAKTLSHSAFSDC